MKTLVLGLGNELMGDDGVGIVAARVLSRELRGRADVIGGSLHGVALLDIFVGYDRAIVIDAICTGQYPPGTILEINPADLRPVEVPSPHFTGLPEMFRLAEEMGLPFPKEVRIMAMEVADPFTVGGEMTPAVRKALTKLIAGVKACVQRWNGESLPRPDYVKYEPVRPISGKP